MLSAAPDPTCSHLQWTFAMTLSKKPEHRHFSTNTPASCLFVSSGDRLVWTYINRILSRQPLYSKSSLTVVNGRELNEQGPSTSLRSRCSAAGRSFTCPTNFPPCHFDHVVLLNSFSRPLLSEFFLVRAQLELRHRV